MTKTRAGSGRPPRREGPPAALAIDVGNTHSALGFFRRGELAQQWRFATRPGATGDELLTILEPLLRADIPQLRESPEVIIGS
ncbi:MAG: type III pantothenate kinase, partial [Candidatus Eisenbacteria bacterium]|nr:type III pantothenate kinase [Candidatus Eisenbacteria bacterium]